MSTLQLSPPMTARGSSRYTEADVESLVDEIRAENYARRKMTA